MTMLKHCMDEVGMTYSYSTDNSIVYEKDSYYVGFGYTKLGNGVFSIMVKPFDEIYQLMSIDIPANKEDVMTVIRLAGIKLPKQNVWNRNQLLNEPKYVS